MISNAQRGDMAKKLYRSVEQRMNAGVCGGIGEYFDFDPTLVRLLAVALVLAGGSGVLAYILAWIIIPDPPSNA
jgi:phage shock protein PspC (stress-responsive transcriptional regulator)